MVVLPSSIAYRSLPPRSGGSDNLLVPVVCLSASGGSAEDDHDHALLRARGGLAKGVKGDRFSGLRGLAALRAGARCQDVQKSGGIGTSEHLDEEWRQGIGATIRSHRGLSSRADGRTE
jgi:hypothetical protein